jgi:TatD DNase family protein
LIYELAVNSLHSQSSHNDRPMIDIGLNLTHDSFDADRDALLARAASAGVSHMIITGASLASSAHAIELVKQYRQCLRSTAGVHPHHASELTEDKLTLLKALMAQPEVVAGGECGLDYFRNLSAPADQLRAFSWQLELTNQVCKPVFLHQRDAHKEFLAVLREQPPIVGGVAHCFTGHREQAKDYLDLGLYIGVTGWICDDRRGTELRDAVRYIPSDRLLIETDAPYLLPRDLQPKPVSRRNEPSYLPHIAKVIAQCRNESVQSVVAASMVNTRKLFGWPVLSGDQPNL